MSKKSLLILFSCLIALASRADVILQDQFTYPNGAIITNSIIGPGTNSLWIRHSGSTSPSDAIVKNGRLEIGSSTAYLGVTATRFDDINRQFSITNGSSYTNSQQLIYASFVMNFTNLPMANGQYFIHFHSAGPTSTTFEGKLWALSGNPLQTSNNFAALPNTFRLGVTAVNSGGPTSHILGTDLALNTDYQVVLCWDPVTDMAISVWVNPISSSDPKAESGDPFTPSAANLVNSFATRQASGFGGFLTISNLVIATTFDEALTNVLSTNAVPPIIVYQPVGNSNFVGASVTLSAVANGQGQASLNYQWFKGSTPYSNPAGNTNVLTIDNAQASDTGDYTLVVTTPYGLSTTSSVAKVSISSAPVPPTFVTQPFSQTIYSGQNVTLNASVSSPGNVTFTWYSNNVVITSGVSASGESTSLELDNVIPSYSATYKVTAVNDVSATVVSSTNAVLTVINPPSVSISYLRSLVDPNNNYTPTNTTTPFEITGVVTTYTNLTTGNTSSYYLQDATAGINIFATFGSTFRPAQGDVVTFVGTLSSFSSGLELTADTVNKPYTSYTVVSNNYPLPAPLSIPFTVTNNNLANVNLSIAGKLVQLSDVYFGANAGATITNGFYTVTNHLGQAFNLWFSSVDQDVMGQTFPTYASTVTGVMFGSMNNGSPNFAVAVTKYSDIVASSIPVTPIPLLINYTAGTLTFNWSDPSFNLQWATNVAGPYTTIPGATSGFSTNTSDLPILFFRLSNQ